MRFKHRPPPPKPKKAVYKQTPPKDCALILQVGLELHRANRLQEAYKKYQEILAIDPKHFDALQLTATLQAQLGNHTAALPLFDQALQISKLNAAVFNNRGNALQELKRLDDALASYAEAIRIKPDYAEAYWNKSLLHLLLGDFYDGWSLYEWRLKKDDTRNNYYSGTERVWRGDWSIEGKRLLIDAEQGFGDSIQFVRYVKNISALGAEVILRMPEPLISLFTASDLPATLVTKGDPLPNFDAYCPLMSLPYALKTSIETIPASIPYLRAEERKITEWQQRLGEEKRFRVGLVWSGSKTHKNDANRSLALKQLLPLLDLPVAWYSLQKEYREEDEILLNDGLRIKRYEKDLSDYSDTAALIAALDLVISVDTSVAHLAGAIGKRVWVLLPYVPDFRWLLDRDDSPWYPTVRIFRQDETRDWDLTLKRVVVELHAISQT